MNTTEKYFYIKQHLHMLEYSPLEKYMDDIWQERDNLKHSVAILLDTVEWLKQETEKLNNSTTEIQRRAREAMHELIENV